MGISDTHRPRLSAVLTATILAVCAVRVWLALNTPLWLRPTAGHDDGLFISHAASILSGDWLGSFSQYTLMKGPGYSFFLAASALSGLPLTATHAVFQLAAIGIASITIWHLTNSRNMAVLSFVLLAFVPTGFELTRVVRDQIYWGQTLVVFSTAALLFLAPPSTIRNSVWLGIFAGVVLGWAWLTREEGFWFVPGIALLIVGRAVQDRLSGASHRRLMATALSLLVGFALPHALFVSANYMAYGSPSNVDFNESNFKAAIKALQSISAGEHVDYVPVSAAAQSEAAKYSPAFAPLAAALRKGQPTFQWEAASCTTYPTTCGEIGGGWFAWALRDAAALNGVYASPAIASQRYGEIASEISAACDSGALKCKASLFSYIPPMTSGQRWSLPRRFVSGLVTASLARLPHEQTSQRSDAAIYIDAPWAFLNYPKILLPEDVDLRLQGWFFDPATNVWPSFFVKDKDNNLTPLQVDRAASPDLVQHFADARPANNRFSANVRCKMSCTLVARDAARLNLEVEFSANASNSSSVEGATLRIDIAEATHPTSYPGRVVKLARHFSQVDVVLYQFLFPALTAVGVVCWLIAATKSVRKRELPTLLIASTSALAFVAVRLLIVAIVDATSFPAIDLIYALPTTYMLGLFSFLSIAMVAKAPIRNRRAASGLEEGA